MPIRKEDKKLYPFTWPEIRKRILERAADRCEGCGVRNYSVGSRLGERWVLYGTYSRYKDARETAERLNANGNENERYIVIVLTIAHLNHNPADTDEQAMRAYCQRCHLAHDKILHRNNAKRTRAQKKYGWTDDEVDFI